MKLIQVKDRRTEDLFLDVARHIYKSDPNWVCPPDNDIRNTFDPAKNLFIREGECIRWILENDNGKIIGRIAAFYNHKKSKAEKLTAGGSGYFECINDQASANILFNAAVEWLRDRGLQTFDAPVNPGENDSNTGLLVEGFTHPGMGMSYNHPYYRQLFENYGFNVYFRQFSYHLDLTKKFPERFWKIAEWIGRKKEFTFKHLTWDNIDNFIKDIVHVYNITWATVKTDFTPIDPEFFYSYMRKVRPIVDGEMIWMAYYKEEPISFFIMIPDANQILKKFNGKLNFLNKLRMFYSLKTRKISRIRAIAAGVVPKFQNSGVESGIFWHMNEKMKLKKQYKEIELSWVGDFNPKMIALYENVGGVKAKVHHTYRYMIDKSVPFERFMPEKAVIG